MRAFNMRPVLHHNHGKYSDTPPPSPCITHIPVRTCHPPPPFLIPSLLHPTHPAQSLRGATFDLAIFDEAHMMAGRQTKARKYSFGLDDASIALERRLFLTATPRKFKQQDVKAEARGESTVVSMDNTTEFGPVVYEMSHQQAVERGIVTPLKLLVYNVSHGYANLCKRVPEVRVACTTGVFAARRGASVWVYIRVHNSTA